MLIYFDLGKNNKFLKLSDEALTLFEGQNKSFFLLQLGRFYAQRESKSKALVFLRQADALNVNESSVKFELGKILALSGYFKEGVKEIDKAREMGGLPSKYLYVAGLLYRVVGRHYDALKCFEMSREAEPSERNVFCDSKKNYKVWHQSIFHFALKKSGI